MKVVYTSPTPKSHVCDLPAANDFSLGSILICEECLQLWKAKDAGFGIYNWSNLIGRKARKAMDLWVRQKMAKDK